MLRHPPSTIPAPSPHVTVTMVAGVVVIEPPAELDHDATDALLRTVVAALDTGESVMLHLDANRAVDPERWPHAAPQHHEPEPSPVPRPVTSIGPGYLRLDTGNDTWTIDLARRRFCRSATPVDPRFVEGPSWTAIRAAWVTGERTTVLTLAGTYVSAPTTWLEAARVVAA